MNIISRQQAISLNLTRYFTGLPCKRGHISERYTTQATCIECLHPTLSKAPSSPNRRRDMARFKVVLHHSSVEFFKNYLLAITRLSWAEVKESDILTTSCPKYVDADGSVYYFRALPVDIPGAISMAQSLWMETSNASAR